MKRLGRRSPTRLADVARVLLPVAVLLGVLAYAAPAQAIPAFARRYETSCSTCHVQFPNLNAFGEAFRRNGYQFPAGADSDAIRQQPMPLVAEARKDLFPRSDWPTDLARYPPLALVLYGYIPMFPDAGSRPTGAQAVSFDDMFGQATLLLGARAGDHVAAFAGVNFISDATVQLERGFLVFSGLAPGGLLNVRVGQFEPQVLSFSTYRRIGGPNYLIQTAPLAPSGFALEPYVRGLDLSGIAGSRFGWNAAWVQGVEAPAYGNSPAAQAPLDGYLHAFTRLGGMRLDGVEPTGAAPGSGASSDPSVDVGVFGYGGHHEVALDAKSGAQGDVLAKVGGDVLARLGAVQLLVATAYERHRYDSGLVQSRVQGLGEVTWRIYPWLAGIVRAETEAGDAGNTRRVVPMLTVHPRINLKLQSYALLGVTGPVGAEQRVTEIDAGATYAF